MLDEIVYCALDFHFFQAVFLFCYGVLDGKFMKGTIFGCSSEYSLSTMKNFHWIVKFHQKALMGHCKNSHLTVLLFVDDVLFN